jgi:hypothetical protein
MKIIKTVNTTWRKSYHCKSKTCKCKPEFYTAPNIPKIKGYHNVGFSAIRYNKSGTKVKGEFEYKKK